MKQNSFLTELLPEELQPPTALDVFLQRIGVTRSTGYAWRKQGKLRTVNISGKQYVPAKEIVAFNRRAEAGEFAKDHHAPPRAGQDAKATRPARPSR